MKIEELRKKVDCFVEKNKIRAVSCPHLLRPEQTVFLYAFIKDNWDELVMERPKYFEVLRSNTGEIFRDKDTGNIVSKISVKKMARSFLCSDAMEDLPVFDTVEEKYVYEPIPEISLKDLKDLQDNVR